MDPLRYMFGKWVYGYSVPMSVAGLLKLGPGRILWLIGSGFGETAMMIHRSTEARVEGFEAVPALVERAKRRVAGEGLSDVIHFHNLYQVFKMRSSFCDAALFESILSFVKTREELFSRVVDCLKTGGRIGVVELMWTRQPTQTDVTNYYNLFGVDSPPVEYVEWEILFASKNLKVVYSSVKKIGLLRKFWQDVSENPLATLANLVKTWLRMSTSSKDREAWKNFRAIYSLLGEKLGVGCFVLEK
uniref:Methyltransferase n=1 Tax=uncultured crenarchaeote TaxID=29281 RepID=H5SB73_9CREN|nr:methyltransferase [uncultured crenarchaeote]